MTYPRLDPAQLPVATRALARALIGCILVRDSDEGTAAGRIVETEAYLPGDPACHAFIGKTLRNATLFGPPHRAYVYQIYGRLFCFNLSSEKDGRGAGVLVRALQPLEGFDLMRRRRGVEAERDLCRGPGRMCQALAIDRSFDGANLATDRRLWLSHGAPSRLRVGRSTRIGVTRAADHQLRFYVAGSAFVSGPSRLNTA